MKANDSIRGRLQDSVETALKIAEGLVKVGFEGKSEEFLFSEKFACIDCGISYPSPEPRTFSFNSPVGACPKCEGLGYFTEDLSDEEEEERLTEALRIYTACSSFATERGSNQKP